MSSPVSDKDFKQAMGQFLTGVTIVSCIRKDGTPYGLTVNSFSSVSLNPRLVLWSLIKENSAAQDFADASSFSISFLASDQTDLCQRFASDHQDRFEGVSWHIGSSGAPVIEDSLCVIECAPWQQYEGGDHIIHVGEVLAIHNDDVKTAPMSYFAGKVNDI